MINVDRLPPDILRRVLDRLGDSADQVEFPPPVFDAMQGEPLAYDPESETLSCRFPVLPEQLNPYGSMQGGMIAAAIDNTIGPLSMLVSPPNFTRHLELKYARPAGQELGYIIVKARFVEQQKRRLFFEAVVESESGERLASAKATHWVID